MIMVSVGVGVVDGIYRWLGIGRGRHGTVVYGVHMLEVTRVYLQLGRRRTVDIHFKWLRGQVVALDLGGGKVIVFQVVVVAVDGGRISGLGDFRVVVVACNPDETAIVGENGPPRYTAVGREELDLGLVIAL